MGIVSLGVSHKTAPVELREHLTIPKNRLAPALNQLKAAAALKEVVVLSTCNRLEVYASPTKERRAGLESIEDFFESLYPHPKLGKAFYRNEGVEAVRQLFRVASGLESMMIGESEILGQVKSAYLTAQEHSTTGKITNVLFQRALFVGKTVRSQTTISEGSTSIGSAAVRLAERIFGQLNTRRVLLLGAGEIAEGTARHLLSQKAGQLVILNRTLDRARRLADLLGGTARSLTDLDKELLHSDIVICSLSLDKPIVTAEQVERLMKERRDRSLYFIDIAVPRNVDPKIHTLDNVYVYNIDDLKDLVGENISKRYKEVEKAAAYVNEKSDEFYEWVRGVLEGKNRALRHKQ